MLRSAGARGRAGSAVLLRAGAPGSEMAFSISAQAVERLGSCFALTVGFERQCPTEEESAGAPSPPRLALALWSNVPASLHVHSLLVGCATARVMDSQPCTAAETGCMDVHTHAGSVVRAPWLRSREQQ